MPGSKSVSGSSAQPAGLASIIGPDGATTGVAYDIAGHKTGMTDPDMGEWLYRWDAAGNLRKQRDARNVMTCFHYDNLNRLVGKSFHANFPDPDVPAGFCATIPPGDYDVSYGYDDGANGVSRRTSSALHNSNGSVNNSTSWTYDARGRVTKETMTITPSGFMAPLSYETEYSYDAADRMHTMTYPDTSGMREIVTTTYNAQGLPYSLTSNVGGTYVSSTTYDVLGRLDQQMLGNQLMVDRDYWNWSDAEGGGRLKRIFLLTAPYNVGQQSNKLLDLMYRYDATGNVLTIQDTINRSTTPNLFQRECFSYDALNRLTRAFTTDSTTCANNPNTAGSGPYDQSYGYTSNGNLTSKTGVGAYTYDAQSPSGCATGTPTSKPHAVRTAGGTTYSYDCNGNLTARSTGSQAVTLNYDAENRLISVNDPARPEHLRPTLFAYNADGQRVVMSNPNNGVVFVGSHMEASWREVSLATMLDSFEATAQGDDVLVNWTTAAETEVMGFNLHRSASPDQPEQQLNAAMIPAQHPGGTTGASYEWLDDDVKAGQTVDHWLEALTLSGGSEWTGPVGVGDGALLAGRAPESVSPSRFRRFLLPGGQRIAMREITPSGETMVYLHTDHLGSYRLATGVVGQVWSSPVGYTPFGEMRYGMPWNSHYLYTGQRFDFETGLYYYGARYYDARLGRLRRRHHHRRPGDPQALNRYSYILNNPSSTPIPVAMPLQARKEVQAAQ